ncbi:MAG: polysaccharide biosynthesis tyrosine autokinase [Chloroflexi bacterium]|nr:polysaccharide biosynthesis tyrosine autokinase [Chloroflexota bacterium]
MELKRYWRLLSKWLWLIVLAALVAGTASYLSVRSQPPTYVSRTTLMVGRTLQSVNPNSYEVYLGEQLAVTYAELVTREPVLTAALESLGLPPYWESLAPRVNVRLVENTQLMEISVLDTNPQRAKALVDAIAKQVIALTPEAEVAQSEERVFAQQQLEDIKAKIAATQEEITRLTEERDAAMSARRISDLNGQISALESKVTGWQGTYSSLLTYVSGGDVNVIQVMEEGTLPLSPVSTNPFSVVALAAASGAALAVAAAFLVEYLEDTIKDQSEAEERLGIATLGTVGTISESGVSPATVALTHPLSAHAEVYRMLRTSLRFALPTARHRRSLMLTSAGAEEGKTTTACNLAAVMAQAGERVILVDADLRRGSIHTAMGLTNDVGLTSLLIGDVDSVDEALQPGGTENLAVLTSGPFPPNPAELLGSARMVEVLAELSTRADTILIDSAPLLAVTDAAVIAGDVTGTVLVYEFGRTRLSALSQAIDVARKAGANIIGAVANRVGSTRGSYGKYRGYGHYEPRPPARKRRSRRKTKQAAPEASED